MTPISVPEDSAHTRQAGVCLHISSLPGPYGIGELGTAARGFVDQLISMGLSLWQFLPLGPTAYGDSPYQPLSTFAGNEMLIGIEDLIGLGLLSRRDVGVLLKLPSKSVDYDALIPAKSRLLTKAAQLFGKIADEVMEAEFEEFLAKNDSAWLHDYAVYRHLKTLHGEKPWPDWNPELAHREDAALRAAEVAGAGQIKAIKILQYLFFRQWSQLRDYARQKGVTLFGDMPIYIALDSADAWANRDLLNIDEDGKPENVAGVPPDYFSEDGQLWGNPLYDWERHAATNYSWWVERLRASSEVADLVRIDHFRGFESYWSIPADADTARNGQWQAGPGDAIFNAMRDALGNLPIVAEDLGEITANVDSLRDRHGIPGMRVLQFEVCNEDFSIDGIGAHCVCYTGTHDNDTTVGWFNGSPDDLRGEGEIRAMQNAVLRVTGGNAETVHTDLIKMAFSTAAQIAIAPMQDFLGLGSEARLNTPGIAGGNWRWRLQDEQLSTELSEDIKGMVAASGRSS